jgi:hypothetical protein
VAIGPGGNGTNSRTTTLLAAPRPTWLRALQVIGLTLMWSILALLTVWAVLALYVDIRIDAWRVPLVSLYTLGVIAAMLKVRTRIWAAALCFAGFCMVLTWWLSLKPSSQGDWQADVTQTAWAGIDGDRVVIHNLRNCDYRTETDYTNCWGDRTVFLSQIRGVDLFLTNWGPRWISHPILSFSLGDDQHIAFSIEARYKAGQSYSAFLGFFRQYELIFIAADERDVIRLRTNYRTDEEVYLYRTRASAHTARVIFLTYVDYLNELRVQPEWYNALTRNCTTTLDRQISGEISDPQPWNYQFVLNGTLDELLYDRNRLVTGGLPFPALKEREHINAAARPANSSRDFSALIRVGRIGF